MIVLCAIPSHETTRTGGTTEQRPFRRHIIVLECRNLFFRHTKWHLFVYGRAMLLLILKTCWVELWKFLVIVFLFNVRSVMDYCCSIFWCTTSKVCSICKLFELLGGWDAIFYGLQDDFFLTLHKIGCWNRKMRGTFWEKNLKVSKEPLAWFASLILCCIPTFIKWRAFTLSLSHNIFLCSLIILTRMELW